MLATLYSNIKLVKHDPQLKLIYIPLSGKKPIRWAAEKHKRSNVISVTLDILWLCRDEFRISDYPMSATLRPDLDYRPNV